MTTKVIAERPTVDCELCGNKTPMLGTKRCDRCWELETRIKHDPELARKILTSATTQPTPDTGSREWRVVHDGPSRPMIETSDGRLLSLSQFEHGHWESYEQEEADIAHIVSDHNAVVKLVVALRTERKHVAEAFGKHRDHTRSVQSVPCNSDWCIACEHFESRLGTVDAALAAVSGEGKEQTNQ